MDGLISRLDIDDEAFSRLLTAGAESLIVRKANPAHYWAHRSEHDDAAQYYWEEVPVSREEYIEAVGADLPKPRDQAVSLFVKTGTTERIVT
jgi:hypothetical protein